MVRGFPILWAVASLLLGFAAAGGGAVDFGNYFTGLRSPAAATQTQNGGDRIYNSPQDAAHDGNDATRVSTANQMNFNELTYELIFSGFDLGIFVPLGATVVGYRVRTRVSCENRNNRPIYSRFITIYANGTAGTKVDMGSTYQRVNDFNPCVGDFSWGTDASETVLFSSPALTPEELRNPDTGFSFQARSGSSGDQYFYANEAEMGVFWKVATNLSLATPSSFPASTPTTLTIDGGEFVAVPDAPGSVSVVQPKCRFNSTIETDATIVSRSQISCDTPALSLSGTQQVLLEVSLDPASGRWTGSLPVTATVPVTTATTGTTGDPTTATPGGTATLTSSTSSSSGTSSTSLSGTSSTSSSGTSSTSSAGTSGSSTSTGSSSASTSDPDAVSSSASAEGDGSAVAIIIPIVAVVLCCLIGAAVAVVIVLRRKEKEEKDSPASSTDEDDPDVVVYDEVGQLGSDDSSDPENEVVVYDEVENLTSEEESEDSDSDQVVYAELGAIMGSSSSGD